MIDSTGNLKRKQNSVSVDLGIPTFKSQIPETDWVIIITSTGKHFYFNYKTSRSVWQLLDIGDEYVHNQFDTLDKDQLILLTAKARGLKISDEIITLRTDDNIEQDSYEEKEAAEDEKVIDAPLEKEMFPREPETGTVAETKANMNPVITGYESSSEEESEAELEAEEIKEVVEKQQTTTEPKYEIIDIPEDEPVQSSDEESDFGDGINLSDLSDLDEENQASQELDFIQMLDEYKLDPYNIWDFEISKVVSDPRFLGLDSNQKRQTAFDKWSKFKIQAGKETNGDSNQNNISDAEAAIVYEIENPTIEFLKFLEQNFKPNKFYIDFKRQHRSNPSFSENQLTDKTKEKYYRDYKLHSKKSDSEKSATFEAFLSSSNIFQNLIGKNQSHITVDRDESEDNFDYWYGAFLKVITHFKVPESIIDNSKLYSVGVKHRVLRLIDILQS